MRHKAWSSIEEVPYCFSRSSVKFQGHIGLKIIEFDPNWAFPDCNSSLNSLMAMKCCTKLETAKKRCPIIFQGHPSNFKVTRDKTSPILTQIGHFQTIGRSQLSNPSDLPCSNFCVILTLWNGSNLGFPGISWSTHGVNGLKFCTLMYPEHLQNRLVHGHSLLIFRIFALFWLSETGQIWGFRSFPGECMEEMAWNFACWCILRTFRTD